MSLSGNKQHLCYGAWVAAAIILAGFNGIGFLSLEGQALEGYSPVIKSLQANLGRLEKVLSVQKNIDFSRSDIQRVFSAYLSSPKQMPVETKTAPKKYQPLKKVAGQPALPDLGGILQVMDKNGERRYVALLDGKAYQANDRVTDFVVEKISAKGVVLRQAGKSWFIKPPNVYYSSDQGQ